MMNMASRETSRCGNFHSVEQVLPFQTSQTFSSNVKELKLLPDNTCNIGNSRTRTMQQALSAKLTVIKYLQNMLPTAVIAFTDGSALGNPGPCGAGAVLFHGHMSVDPIKLKIPVSSKSSSYHAEVHGILLVLQYITAYCKKHSITKIHLFCDCRSAVQVICNPSLCGNFQDILWSIRQLVDELNSSNIETLISWVGGHIDLKPNDLADDLAKKAAEEARGLTESPPLSYSEFKNLIKVSSLKKWQTYWTNNSSSLNVKELHPKVSTKRYISVTNKSVETKHMKIVSRHNKLQIHHHKIGFSKTSSCECGYPIQDEKHIMLQTWRNLSSQWWSAGPTKTAILLDL